MLVKYVRSVYFIICCILFAVMVGIATTGTIQFVVGVLLASVVLVRTVFDIMYLTTDMSESIGFIVSKTAKKVRGVK